MKHAFSSALIPVLSQLELRQLSIEVKETLANHSPAKRKKSFTSAQLWNIQNQRKTAAIRRHIRTF